MKPLSELIENYPVIVVDNNMVTLRDIDKLRAVAIELAKAIEELNIPYQAFAPSKMPRLPNEIITEALTTARKMLGEK